MRYSHSRVECHNNCPYQYKLRYVDKLKTIPALEANDALICGNTIHKGAETDLKQAMEFYYSNYPIISDLHINEAMKFEYLIPKILEILDEVNVYKKEFKINTDRFIGIVDLITKNDDGTVDVFDYKYSNNYEHYLESPQLHLYKYFLETIGFKVRKLGFIFIPKISIRQKQEENLYKFRRRLYKALNNSKIKIMEIQYNAEKLAIWMNDIINITEDSDYKKNPTNLCNWCEYSNYCLKEIDYEILNLKEIDNMKLPSTERRDITKTTKRKLWIYGPAFSGKTSMLDNAPNPLNLNTDGNVQFVTMPFIPIKDEVTVNGRITERKFAWEVFKEAIAELEKKQNDFKTIIVDLLEDTREMCRLYKYDELGIQHESDSGFGKGWDIIKTEYLSTIRRLFNLDYENIVVISHEDVSKDITKKNGQNITRIAPNIQDAIALKVAGMVDIVARVVVDGDERTLNFKTNEVIFGGGRLKGITKTSIPLSWEELMKVYEEANSDKVEKTETKSEDKPARRSRKSSDEIKEETTPEIKDNVVNEGDVSEEKTKDISEVKSEEPSDEKPRTRRHRAVKTNESKDETPTDNTEEPKDEEKPQRKTRRSARA